MVVSCESELGDGGLLMFVVERDFGLLWLWMSVTWKPLSKASFGILWSFTTPDVCVLYLHNPTWVINTIIVILIWFCFALAFPRLHKTFITDRGRPYTDTPFVIPPGILKSSQPERDDPNLCMVLHLNTFNIYIYILIFVRYSHQSLGNLCWESTSGVLANGEALDKVKLGETTEERLRQLGFLCWPRTWQQ